MTALDARRAPPTDRCIPVATNLAIAGGLILSQAWLWVVLPVYLLPVDALWGWTLVPVALTTTTGFGLYGPFWPMLAAVLLARGFLLSFFDNAYHYGTPPGDVLSAMNLRLPRWAELGILNFNLHGVHQRAPALPWRALAGAFRDTGAQYDAGYLPAALRQIRGPAPPPAAPVHQSLTRM